MCRTSKRGNSPSPIACEVSEKAPEISACEATIVASVARTTSGSEQRRRREAVEQLAARDRRAAKEMRALSEIVEQQRGKDHGEPADADRPGAEMPEVRVHGLAAGDDQHQRAENQQRLAQAGAREEGGRHARD